MEALTDIEAKFLRALRDAGAVGETKALDTGPLAERVGVTKNVAAFALNALATKGVAGRSPDGKWFAR